jgi:hypothetical protein
MNAKTLSPEKEMGADELCNNYRFEWPFSRVAILSKRERTGYGSS